MANDDLVQLRLQVKDGRAFVAGVDQASASVRRLGRASSEAGAQAKKADETHSFFRKSIGGVGIYSRAAGVALGFLAVQGLGGFIDQANQSIKVAAQTNAVLLSTHHAAHVSASGVSGLALSLANMAGVDDESVQSMENMLLTFTNVRNEAGRGNDIFNQATKTVLDMSTALGEDGKNAAIQLGKALSDPIKGITALQRVGVTFNGTQKTQIANFVQMGDTMDAQRIILAELNREFGGSAQAFGKTMPGAIGRMRMQVGNLVEDLGGKLAPTMAHLGTDITEQTDHWNRYAYTAGVVHHQLDDLGHGIVRTYGWLDHHRTLVRDAVFAYVAWKVAVIALTAAHRGFLALRVAIVATETAIGTGAFLAAAGVTSWADAMAAVSLIIEATPVGWIITAVALLIVGLALLVIHFKSVRNAIGDVVVWTRQHFGGVYDAIIRPFVKAVMIVYHAFASIIGALRGLVSQIDTTSHGMWQPIADAFRGVFNWIMRRWHDLTGIIHSIGKLPGVHAAGGALGALKSVSDSIPGLAGGGTVTAPGWTLVGESGPELRYEGRGATIVPLDHAARDAAGGRAAPLAVQVVLDGRVVTEAVFKHVEARRARR